MDPNETFLMMLEAHAEGRFQDADDLADDLRGWIGRGGVPPALSLTDRFNRPRPIDPSSVRQMIELISPSTSDVNDVPGPSPLDG